MVKLKPNTERTRVDIVRPNGRRLRHLPQQGVYQYRMHGIRRTKAHYELVELTPFMTVIAAAEPLRFHSLSATCAWADYIADRILAALFDDGDDPAEPTTKPIEPLDLPPLLPPRRRSDSQLVMTFE
jgi:hypothetical protein